MKSTQYSTPSLLDYVFTGSPWVGGPNSTRYLTSGLAGLAPPEYDSDLAGLAGLAASPDYDYEIADDVHLITMNVAGYAKDDISIEVDKNTLTIVGTKSTAQRNQNRTTVRRGIGTSAFKKQFTLPENAKVACAYMEAGLLTIEVIADTPEVEKPIKIPITG